VTVSWQFDEESETTAACAGDSDAKGTRSVSNSTSDRKDLVFLENHLTLGVI
jgi:hypothetical protein